MTENSVRNIDPQDEDWGQPLEKLELGVLVLDASGSMRRPEPASGVSKAEMVVRHLAGQPGGSEKSLLKRLQDSTRAQEMQVAMVTFDHRVRRALEPTPVAELPPIELDLLKEHGGATAIGLALREAGRIAQTFLAAEEEGIPRYAIILLMTDGREEGPQVSDESANPLTVAQAIKAEARVGKGQRPNVIIAGAAYGDDADEELLKKLVSPPVKEEAPFFRRVHSGEEMRDFFMQSIAVVDQATA